MFPIAFSMGNISGRTLKADDIAGGLRHLCRASFSRETGSISGKVTKSGNGVLGAHVVAFDTRTKTLVGGFSLSDDGSFVIAGLDPGPHILRVEPLDDGDIESFFDLSLNIDVNFRPQFYNKIVVVPRGGGTGNIELKWWRSEARAGVRPFRLDRLSVIGRRSALQTVRRASCRIRGDSAAGSCGLAASTRDPCRRRKRATRQRTTAGSFCSPRRRGGVRGRRAGARRRLCHQAVSRSRGASNTGVPSSRRGLATTRSLPQM
jgi:hypothetical protein